MARYFEVEVIHRNSDDPHIFYYPEVLFEDGEEILDDTAETIRITACQEHFGPEAYEDITVVFEELDESEWNARKEKYYNANIGELS